MKHAAKVHDALAARIKEYEEAPANLKAGMRKPGSLNRKKGYKQKAAKSGR